MSYSEQGGVVRDRILRVATELFVAHGYKTTSTRRICEVAEANNAMVNYYFGSKENLYLAVFGYARSLEIKSDGGMRKPAGQVSPEAQLHEAIEEFLKNLLLPGPSSSLAKLIAKELIDPSGVIGSIVDNDILPQHRHLGEIIRAAAHRKLSDEDVQRFIFSIIGQCLFYSNNRPINELIAPAVTYDGQGISETAGYIHRFAMAALRAF